MELKLRTPVTIPPRPGILTHSRPVILLGSCFSDNIGRRLAERGYDVAVNPLGPVYNPIALARQAELIASGREVCAEELFLHENLWRHPLAHTLLARPERDEAARALNDALSAPRRILSSSIPPLICLTLGTARTFFDINIGLAVANCHKLPQSYFSCRMITLDEATAALRQAVRLLNSSAQSDVIVTISPIRYLADGLECNSLSKATLRLAADSLTSDGVIYFPAFEALTDDLRDYRFYAPDMIHPTEQAADYVYALFEETFATADTREQARRAFASFRRSLHRPMLSQR